MQLSCQEKPNPSLKFCLFLKSSPRWGFICFLPAFSGMSIYWDWIWWSIVATSDFARAMVLFSMERWTLNKEYFTPVVKTFRLSKISTPWICYCFLLQPTCLKISKITQKRGKFNICINIKEQWTQGVVPVRGPALWFPHYQILGICFAWLPQQQISV